ncbi:MAG: TetR/AcrR family transcriptional regulator [Eubacteriales bacterium]|nr:TetR/AcrR family transcriptional regulator [Eubacteriales bacterium]MDD3882859.1 TetR/AcrR family transcriptional regulator [Eubacteriales bacterium]MDD4512105.1 TetR/AcrR family transcriptional regulator [Eubacteriales bacterium]
MDSEASARRRQAERTRRKLLDSALRRFALEGYGGAKVKEICGDAGMADGILYHYFPDGKQEMFETIAREEFFRISGAMESWLSETEALPLREALESLLGGVARGLEEHLGFLKIILRDAEMPPIPECGSFSALMEEKRKWLPRMLEKRAAGGEIRHMDFESAAASVIAVIADHCFIRVSGFGGGVLTDDVRRGRYIDYLCSIWLKEKENA